MTTATIPAGPIFPSTEVVTASNTPALGTTFTLLKSVKIALDGEKKNEGTKKLVKDWLKTNKKVIKDASMQEELDVSSWAIVLDVEFGAMRDVRTTTATSPVYQAVGTTGDKVAVLVNVDAGSYTQNALHIANTITTARSVDASGNVTAQVDSIAASTRPLTVTVDYTKTTNTAAAGTWGTETVCGTKWSGACNGLSAPWGLHTLVQPTTSSAGTAVNGSVRAWKWLGDKGSSASKVMQIEKDDKLNILCYEFVDTYYVNAAWVAAVPRWAVSQYTVTGASQLVASAAALIAASQLF